MIPMGCCGPVDHAYHRPKRSGDLEPNTSGLNGRCPDLQTRGPYCRHFQPANQSFSFFSIHAPICIWAAASMTRISSSRTCRTAANTTRLSMVGRATPCCHLYIACGVAKPKISCLLPQPVDFLSCSRHIYGWQTHHVFHLLLSKLNTQAVMLHMGLGPMATRLKVRDVFYPLCCPI